MTLFRNLFIMLFAVIIIPTLVLMTINYQLTKNFVYDEAKLNNHQIVKQAKVATDSIISQTEKISQQITLDRSVQQFMFEKIEATNYDDYQVLDDIYNVMVNFMAGTQYIKEISIYKLENDLLVSTSETEQPAISIKTEEYIKKLSISASMKMWIQPNSSGVYWEQLSEFHFVRFIYTNVDELVGFVVIKLKNNDFDRLINEMYIKEDGMLFIADQTGKLLLSSDVRFRNIVDLNLTYDWFKIEENYKEIDIDGIHYFISMVTSDYNNWKYISLIDTKDIQDKLAIIRTNTILLVAFFIMVSFGLSYAMSKGIYNPIQLIKSTIDRDTIKLHKYNFYRLLKGENVEEEELVRKRQVSKFKDIPMYPLEYELILFEFVDLDRHGEESKQIVEERKVIFDELLIQQINKDRLIENFYETNSRMVILLNSSQLDIEHQISTLKEIESLYEQYKQITGGDAYIVMSDKTKFGGIRDSYEYILKILKYSIVKKQTGIMEEVKFENKKDLKRLPYDYQSYLNKSLRAASLDDCVKIIEELEVVIKGEFYFSTNYSFYYKDVLNTIIGFLYEIQYIRSCDMSEIIENFSEFDKRFRSIDEATTWTIQFIKNIFTFIQEADQSTIETPVIRCIHIIEEEYMNDISLNEVAERLELSVPYLSKQFKDETGINFKDYVTLCKINKAKQLLIESTMTNEKIALEVGYNNSLQLVRMFKKLENITPSEFRKRKETISSS